MQIKAVSVATDHQEVWHATDEATGLSAIIAVHNTHLGPALGGTRLWSYANFDDALFDVLRLSRGMSYKNAAAGLPLGGGKAVIMARSSVKDPELLRAYGRFVDHLQGRYVTAEDVNTSVQDMLYIKESTAHVSGLPQELGGSGDPSPFTALGTFEGIRASAKERLAADSLQGLTVAVQGLGSVGRRLCEHLLQAGARLVVADIHAERVQALQSQGEVRAVSIDEIYSVPCDVFAPCALGAVINDTTLSKLQCAVVAGAANNQLLDESHAEGLRKRGILYAPDFIINAGGVINISLEINRAYDAHASTMKVREIYQTLEQIYTMAKADNVPTVLAANHLAEMRLKSAN